MTQSVLVNVRVAAIVESAWHRVPGGVAVSTHHSVHAAAAHPDIELVGVHARHRDAAPAGLAPSVPTATVPLPRPVLYDLWHAVRRPRLQRWTGSVDVVHATTAAIPPHGDARLVATIHDLAVLSARQRSTRRGARLVERGLALARSEAAIVTVPSRATRAECVSAGIDPERVRVVPWGCTPVAVSDADRLRVRSAYDLPDRFVLWVGTLEPRKNLSTLFAAHRPLAAEVPLVLVGPVGWGDVEVAGATEGVRRLGHVPGVDLAVLYDLATVFVLPSHAEGFGMPVLEAMAQGTAVVTSAGTATEEVVGEAGVVVDPTDAEALTGAIRALLDDDTERERVAAAGRARATLFTWERTGAALADAYREAAA